MLGEPLYPPPLYRHHAAASCRGRRASGGTQHRPSERRRRGIEPVGVARHRVGCRCPMRLYHPDRRFALRLIESAVAEVARLEKIFSLYRDDSQLVRLNRAGRLSRPSADSLALLSQSRETTRSRKARSTPASNLCGRLTPTISRSSRTAKRTAGCCVATRLGAGGFQSSAFLTKPPWLLRARAWPYRLTASPRLHHRPHHRDAARSRLTRALVDMGETAPSTHKMMRCGRPAYAIRITKKPCCSRCRCTTGRWPPPAATAP